MLMLRCGIEIYHLPILYNDSDHRPCSNPPICKKKGKEKNTQDQIDSEALHTRES
jgi:hypothetical protein